MTQDRATPQGNAKTGASRQKVMAASYYGLMGLHPSASVREIRQAYRDLSKLYHPDTTALTATIATAKFQQLNEAYATLSSPERRTAYDRKIGYGYVSAPGIQPASPLRKANGQANASSAYLDPTDRPLSPGEIFALFILGLTFVGCLVLAIAIGITRGEAVLQPNAGQPSEPQASITVKPDSTAQTLPTQPAALPPILQPTTPPSTGDQMTVPVADPLSLPPSATPPA